MTSETSSLKTLAALAKDASQTMAKASTAIKDAALQACATALEDQTAQILRANEDDLERAKSSGSTNTVLDRLRLNDGRLAQMSASLRDVAALPDPIGEVVDGWLRPNGLRVRRIRVPLGVIGIVYENRPNVTSDSAALCLKAGNAVLLRGSAGAISSNIAIAKALRKGIESVGLPGDAVILIEDVNRETVEEFVRLSGFIDCLIPRGGPGLVKLVKDRSTVPYVVDGDGNCHVFVDRSADIDMALEIVANAKMQRPSVCNAMETLLVHKDIASELLQRLAAALPGVEIRGDETTLAEIPTALAASDDDYANEFLAMVLAVAVVDDIDAAVAHIARYSSGHSEAIVTSDYEMASRFVQEVDAAAVLVNASTRFVDGAELGLGAEIGISTQKLHARGPMGLKELTSVKFVVEGNGQVRH